MAFIVSEFLAAMKYDGARPNLFQFSINFPATVIGDAVGAAQAYTFFAKTGSLPGSSIGSVSVNYFGRELKFAGNRVFPEWSVTIINDEDFRIRNAFELWLNGINMHVANLRNAALLDDSQYQVEGHAIQFGKTGNTLKNYKLFGMFPTDLSPIDLDWGSNDAIEEYTVTFAYQWWEQVPADATGGGNPADFNIATQ